MDALVERLFGNSKKEMKAPKGQTKKHTAEQMSAIMSRSLEQLVAVRLDLVQSKRALLLADANNLRDLAELRARNQTAAARWKLKNQRRIARMLEKIEANIYQVDTAVGNMELARAQQLSVEVLQVCTKQLQTMLQSMSVEDVEDATLDHLAVKAEAAQVRTLVDQTLQAATATDADDDPDGTDQDVDDLDSEELEREIDALVGDGTRPLPAPSAPPLEKPTIVKKKKKEDPIDTTKTEPSTGRLLMEAAV